MPDAALKRIEKQQTPHEGPSLMTDWEIHGMQFTNCSCNYGCPCQFNALPTHGYCRAVVFVRIDQGRFGNTALDGLNMGFAVAWPGAVHQGHGSMQPIVDDRGNAEQRKALFNIMTGKETDPMVTFFAIYTAMCDTVRDPVATKITIDVDINGRLAKCEAKDVATGRGQPILNPVTKKEFRGGIVLPNGMEYGQCEVGRGWSESLGAVPMAIADSHAHWSELHMNRHGRIH